MAATTTATATAEAAAKAGPCRRQWGGAGQARPDTQVGRQTNARAAASALSLSTGVMRLKMHPALK